MIGPLAYFLCYCKVQCIYNLLLLYYVHLHTLEMILYCLVTISGGHFKLCGGWSRPLWEIPNVSRLSRHNHRFFFPALIFNMFFTGCGTLYLQLLAVKPKNKNSKNPVATDFIKKFKHYSYPEEAEGWWLKVSLSQIN